MYAAQLAAVPSYRPRPRRAVGHRQDLLGRDVGEPDARRPAGAARLRRHRRLRGDGPRRPAAAVRRRPTSNLAAVRRRAGATSSRRWTRCGRTPPRSPSTGRSSRCPTTSATRSGASSSTGSPRATRGELGRGRARDRPVRRALSRPVPRRSRGAGRACCSCGAGDRRSPPSPCTAWPGACRSGWPRPCAGAARAAAGLVARLAFALGWVGVRRLRRARPAGGRLPDRRRLRGLRAARRPRSCCCWSRGRPARRGAATRAIREVHRPQPRMCRVNDPSPTRAARRTAAGSSLAAARAASSCFGGAYVAAYFLAGDKVPRGTTVAGVDIGGRTAGRGGRRRCATGWPSGRAAPITVTVDGDAGRRSTPADGRAVGRLRGLGRRGRRRARAGRPARLWDYFTGGDDLDAVVAVDDDAMTRDPRRARPTRSAPRPATARSASTAAGSRSTAAAAPARASTRTAARDALAAAFLGRGRRAGRARRSRRRARHRRRPTCRQALDDFANPAVSGPVTLVFGESPVKLRPGRLHRRR